MAQKAKPTLEQLLQPLDGKTLASGPFEALVLEQFSPYQDFFRGEPFRIVIEAGLERGYITRQDDNYTVRLPEAINHLGNTPAAQFDMDSTAKAHDDYMDQVGEAGYQRGRSDAAKDALRISRETAGAKTRIIEALSRHFGSAIETPALTFREIHILVDLYSARKPYTSNGIADPDFTSLIRKGLVERVVEKPTSAKVRQLEAQIRETGRLFNAAIRDGEYEDLVSYADDIQNYQAEIKHERVVYRLTTKGREFLDRQPDAKNDMTNA